MATNDGHEQRRPTLVFDSLLESAFRIRPGEFRVVALMFVYLLLVVSTFIIGRTVRDTLFLHRVALDRLPLMYISVAAAVALASWIYSFIADHYRRDRLLIATLAGFSAITAGFWLAIQTRPGAWIYFALYICVEILGAISIMQFWTFANDLFNGRQAKRLFGLIGAGGVIANIVCGFSIGLIAPVLGTEALLIMIAGLFAACIAIVHLVAGPARSALEQSVHKPRRSSLKLGLVTDRVLHSKHLQIIAGIVVVTFATVTLVDFQFKVLVRTHYQTEAELAAYFGYFYAFTGIIASLMQFLITGRLLERFGIVVALAILPIALSAGAFGILLLPALFAGTLAKGAENIFRYTINDATTQLLYVPIPSHHRGRAKAFIDGIVKQSSIALSGLLLLVTGHLFAAEQLAVSLAYIDLTLLVIWLVLIFGIRKEYIKSLIDTLQSQRLDPTETWSPIVDEQTARLLQKRLRSKNEDEVWTTLEILQALPADFQRELLALLDHSSERIRIRALVLIGHSGRLDGAHHIHRLCRDDSADVRSAAITAFCAVGNERAVHAVRPFLIDAESRVRAATVTAMIRHGGLDGILTAAETLKTFLNSEQAQERLHGARILRDIKVKNFFQPVLTLLQDHDVQVRIAAVEAAGQMRSPELVPALIYRLADAPTAMTAVRALVAYGPSIEPTLFKVLQNPKEDLRVRRRIPRILERFGRQEAFAHLVRALASQDPELRAQVARAASRIRERHPRLTVDEGHLTIAVRDQLEAAYRVLAIIMALDLPTGHLLSEALLERHRQHLDLAFGLLEIRYPARTIQLVHANLDAEHRVIRANALEVVDNVLDKEEARILLPLLEDHSLQEKVQKGRETFPLASRSDDDWLHVLIEDAHPWIVSCTLHHVAEQGLTRFMPQVIARLDDRDPIVRETAVVALDRLLTLAPQAAQPAEWLAQLRRLSDGDVLEVRRVAADVLARRTETADAS